MPRFIGKRRILATIHKGINPLLAWINSLDNILKLTILFSLFLNAFFYFVWTRCPVKKCPSSLFDIQRLKYSNSNYNNNHRHQHDNHYNHHYHHSLPKELEFLTSTALIDYNMAESTSFDKTLQKKRMRLSHIVMPFHIRQIDRAIKNIQLWVKYPPCAATTTTTGNHDNTIPNVNSYYRRKRDLNDLQDLPLGHNVTMIFFVSCKKDYGVTSRLINAFKELPENVKSCFVDGDPLVRFAKLTGRMDEYIRGSRMMFHQMLNGHLGIYEPSYILQMEPDAVPIRPHWLSIADSTTRHPNPEFWIKGTAFTGSTRVLNNPTALLNLFHINGNAIYNLADHGFKNFYFHQVSAWNFGRMPDVAYDVGIYRYLLCPTSYNLTRHVAHKFQYTKFIQNPWKTEYSLKTVKSNHEMTFMIHSGTQNP